MVLSAQFFTEIIIVDSLYLLCRRRGDTECLGALALSQNAVTTGRSLCRDENASNLPAKHANHTKRICGHLRASAVKKILRSTQPVLAAEPLIIKAICPDIT